MSFGANMKHRRKLLNLDRTHMASAMGITLEAYRNIESGKLDDTIRLIKIARGALGVNYEYLFAVDAEDFNIERKRSMGKRGY